MPYRGMPVMPLRRDAERRERAVIARRAPAAAPPRLGAAYGRGWGHEVYTPSASIARTVAATVGQPSHRSIPVFVPPSAYDSAQQSYTGMRGARRGNYFFTPIGQGAYLRPIGMGDQSAYDRVNKLQNDLTTTIAAIAGIGPAAWAEWADQMRGAISVRKPGFGWAPYDTLLRDLRNSISRVLVSDNFPSDQAQADAAKYLAAAQGLVALYREEVPQVAAASAASEADTAARIANLPQMRDPAVVGREVFVQTVKERAAAMTPGLGLSIPTWAWGGAAAALALIIYRMTR